LIRLVNFLLVYEKKVEYNKATIDSGDTPRRVYEICSCIRETFCLSYSIRKNNNFLIYFQNKHILITFLGQELRYLGPDERSQALLLEKAMKKAEGIEFEDYNKRIKSTPGIYVLKFADNNSFNTYLDLFISDEIYIIKEGIDSNHKKKVDDLFISSFYSSQDDTTFIILIDSKLREDFDKFLKFKDNRNIKFLSLTKIKSIEDIILYLNFRRDHHMNL